MSKFEKVPSYVDCADPTLIPALKKQLDEFRLHNPAYDLNAPSRRAALAAILASNQKVPVTLWLELGHAIPADYRVHGDAVGDALAADHVRQVAAQQKYKAEKREAEAAVAKQREAGVKPVYKTQREAQAYLSPTDYIAWCRDNQLILARSVLG